MRHESRDRSADIVWGKGNLALSLILVAVLVLYACKVFLSDKVNGTGQPKATLCGHRGMISCLAFSPDGRLLVSGSTRRGIKLWATASGTEKRTLGGHDGVSALVFTPDGNALISGGYEGTIKLWDLRTLRATKTIHLGTEPIRDLALNAEGTVLASAGPDRMVRLWAFPSMDMIAALAHAMEVTRIAFAPDGKTLAAGMCNAGPDRQNPVVSDRPLPHYVDVWDIPSKTKRVSLSGHDGWVSALAYTPDGKILVTGGFLDRAVRLWDVGTWRQIGVLRHGQKIHSVVAAPDGKTIFSGGGWDAMMPHRYEDAVRIWDLASGRVLGEIAHPEGVISMAITADGRTLATGCRDCIIRLWDLPD